MDHIGGAGAFDELYINPADNYFLDVSFEKMLESRRNYADFIRKREDKYYPYSTEKDMLCWEKNRSCFRYPTVRHSILEGVSLRHIAVPDIPPAK